MTSTLIVTINDILQRNSFKHAKVVAGNDGISNSVKWTHILETNDFHSLINGHELILTTGTGLSLDTQHGVNYIKSMITKNASGICIELGTHVDQIAQEIIELANEANFPIIVFDRFVKFVDITQDLHSTIINKHHHMLKTLNELSMRFNELSLLPNGILKILEQLHANFNGSVLFVNENKTLYYPLEAKSLDEYVHKYLTNQHSETKIRNVIDFKGKKTVTKPVKSSGINWGYLCLQVEDKIMPELLFSVLDQAALAIAQIMLRNRTIEERKQNAEGKMVRTLLYGKDYNLDELKTKIPLIAQQLPYRLIVLQPVHGHLNIGEHEWNEIQLQQAIILKSTLQQHGYFPAISVKKDEIAIIAFFNEIPNTSVEINKCSQLIETIKNIQEKNIMKGDDYNFGVSRIDTSISRVNEGYEETKKVLSLQKSNIQSSIFYDELGIYQLLLHVSKKYLQPYVEDFLQPLIDYDHQTNNKLLKTLEVYLKCSGAKKETAEQLFIVRQTLYHRLQKIEELLGKDFLEPNKRLSIETAIKARKVLFAEERQ